MGMCLGKHAGKQAAKKEFAVEKAAHTADQASASNCIDSRRPAACVVGYGCQSAQQAGLRRGTCVGPAVVAGCVASHTIVQQPSHQAEICGSTAHHTSGLMGASDAVPTAVDITQAAPAVIGVSVEPPVILLDGGDMGVGTTAVSWHPTGTTLQPLQPSATVNKQRVQCTASQCVTFAQLGPHCAGQSALLMPYHGSILTDEGADYSRNGLSRRSDTSAVHGSSLIGEGQISAALSAKQAVRARCNKMGKLQKRRGGLDSSFQALQDALEQSEKPLAHVNTRAAGLKHIGFGPFKRENQDEFFIQVGGFGGQHSSNLFCVFDGHGSYGKDAASYSRQLLPKMLGVEVAKYLQQVNAENDPGLKGAVEMLITEVFGETERSIIKSGVNLSSSGTTASVAFQHGNRLWVASAGDSRVVLCSRNAQDPWKAAPLTLDHRPRRLSERRRVEAAGARVAPKRLPSGQLVGEPRLWLRDAHGPGLMLSRSLGDLAAATVGCTSDPEVSYTTLRPGVDHLLVMATDGIWDVLTNEQVCDIVVEAPDPHLACRRVLDAALYEWEERLSADNITVLVVEFDWGEEGNAAISIG